jgi:glutathione S-transferase
LNSMEAKLYVILGSHACRTAMLMMEHKGIPYERKELPTGLHPFLLRLRGFSGNPAPFRRFGDRVHRMLGMADRFGTVPALRFNGQRVKTNRGIARFIEQLKPEPPLFPADPEARRAVEEAERWGDELFQMAARRLALTQARRGREGLVGRGEDGRLGTLLFRQWPLRLIGTRLIALFIFGANSRAEEELRAALPAQLDRIDAWIEAGVLNGEQLNAADFMIAPSLALLTYLTEIRTEIERRPSLALIDRLLPDPAAPRAYEKVEG